MCKAWERVQGLRRTAVWLLLLTGLPASAVEAPLDLWLANQAGLRSWTASFRQTRVMAVLKEPLVARGRVWFAEPGLFRWELGDPVQTRAVRGSNELAVVYPRLRRAERHALARLAGGPMRDLLALLDAGFPRSRSALEARFEIRSQEELGDGLHRVVLEPRSVDARRLMSAVWIEFVPGEPGPRSTELRFADGTRLRNDFSSPELNPVLPGDWFNPAIPDGFRVTGD